MNQETAKITPQEPREAEKREMANNLHKFLEENHTETEPPLELEYKPDNVVEEPTSPTSTTKTNLEINPNKDIDWQAVLNTSYANNHLSPSFKEELGNIKYDLAQSQNKPETLDNDNVLLLTYNNQPEDSTEKNKDVINNYLNEQSPEQKEKIVYGLNTLGYRFDKRKNEIIANILEKSASQLSGVDLKNDKLRDQGTLVRFLHGLALGRKHKAEQTEKIIDNIQNKQGGLLTSAGNIGRPVGTALKIGRILNDIGAGAPLRSIMLIASGVEEVSRGAKEARLGSDAVLRKKADRNTGLKWHEKEALRKKGQEEGKTEEEIEEEISIQETARETEINLDNTLYGSLTRKMRSYDELKTKRQRLQKYARRISKGNKNINNLDEARLMLSGMTQGVAQWQNKFWLNRVQKKLTKIEQNKNLSNEKKELKKQKLFASYENKLKEIERMISGYGTIDVLAMAAKNVESTSKGVVLAMMADTLYKAGVGIYNLALDHSEILEKIVTQEEVTPDGLESDDTLTDSPHNFSDDYSKGLKFESPDTFIEKTNVPADINLDTPKPTPSRFNLFENTGAEVITDPQGKVYVTYEIGNNGDFKTLDQALRRVVMQSYDDQTPNIFDKVEAARLENVLANTREILQGHTINGITPLQIKESAQLVDGKLIISDYDKFNNEILKPLFTRAATKIDQDSPIIKYAQATNESVWQEMLSEKNGSQISSIEPGFAKEVTPPENLPSEFTNNEIKKTSIPIEKNILTGSEPIENLKHTEIKTPATSLLDKVSSDIQNRFRLPEKSADHIVNTLMIDSNGNLDQNQLQIFNDIVNRTQNPDAILSALDITRSLNWNPSQEMKLARAFVNPDKIPLWQETFGPELIPANAKVTIDGPKIIIHRIGGFTGSLAIDFANQKMSLGRLLGQNNWATDRARFFDFTTISKNTFASALNQVLQTIRQAK